jgi:malate dehydrogenase (oxaloacetate-decarboxylating)(NADP+)
MMVLEREMVFFADTTVNIDPDAGTLAETALLAADFVRRLGLVPRVAMLSFSNFGSVRSPQSDKVRAATELVKQRAPDLEVDGEMQADTAAMDDFRFENYPFTSLRGRPNIYIFPNLDAANAAYKLMWRMGGAEAFGPILLGMGHPIHVLQRGSEAVDVLNLTALAVADAQEHAGRRAGG